MVDRTLVCRVGHDEDWKINPSGSACTLTATLVTPAPGTRSVQVLPDVLSPRPPHSHSAVRTLPHMTGHIRNRECDIYTPAGYRNSS